MSDASTHKPGDPPAPSPTACPYCRFIVGGPVSFSRWWHLGRGPDAPSCCLTEQYQRRQRAATQQPQPQPQPSASGPIPVAPRSGGGQTSPVIFVEEPRT